MRIGVAADHGGFELKEYLIPKLKASDFEVVDFGAFKLTMGDDYPDFVIPLALSVAKGAVQKGLAICGSGVGACVAANKVSGVRAALITDVFPAHQGVEDDDINVMCPGGRATGHRLAWDLVQSFLRANFKGTERFRRLQKRCWKNRRYNNGKQPVADNTGVGPKYLARLCPSKNDLYRRAQEAHRRG